MSQSERQDLNLRPPLPQIGGGNAFKSFSGCTFLPYILKSGTEIGTTSVPGGSVLVPEVPQRQFTRSIPPGAVSGRDEQSNSALCPSPRVQRCNRGAATKNCTGASGGEFAGVDELLFVVDWTEVANR